MLKQHRHRRAARTAAASVLLLAGVGQAGSAPANGASVCAALEGTQVGVEHAESVAPTMLSGEGAAARTMPAYCRVAGALHPARGSRIGFELWLPAAAAWTGRFQMVGNGGYASNLPTAAMAAALMHGSAVVATDTGHHGDDPDFARDHPEAIIDWGWRAVHLTATAAKSVIEHYYGRPAAHSYFNGCSTGGHQAMMEAQRFPDDFDGIVAGAPGSDRVRLNAAFLWQFLANHRIGRDDSPILDSQDLTLLQHHSEARCPARKEPGDAWVAKPLSCRPDPGALLCVAGRKIGCLSAEKVRTARAMYAGARDPRTGARLTYPWLPGSETGWDRYWSNPQRPEEPARVNFWRIWAFRPGWDWWRFSFARDLPIAMKRLSPIIDATNPDLSGFRAHGGKLLQYHGLADPVVSPLNTLAYRAQVLRMMHLTPKQLSAWFRLYLIPGMGHCAGGPGFTTFDTQAAMERWVEDGQAPETLSTTSSERPGEIRVVDPVGTGRL